MMTQRFGYLFVLIVVLIAGIAVVKGRSFMTGPRESEMPESYAKEIGRLCERRDTKDDVLLIVRDPRNVGKRMYEYVKAGSRTASPRPIEGVPIEKQKVVIVQNIECVGLIVADDRWLLPIVQRPSYQIGLSGPYVERLDNVSSLMNRSYPEVPLKKPTLKMGEKLIIAIRCRDDDPKWRLLGPVDDTAQKIDMEDIKKLDAVDEQPNAQEIRKLISLAELHPYDDESDLE